MQEKLSQLPKMDELLEDVAIAPWFEVFDRSYVKNCLNEALNQVRQAILAGEDVDISHSAVVAIAERKLTAKKRPNLRPMINATGTALHTNLGRALLSDKAIEATQRVNARYSNLEYNVEAGERGSRYAHIENLLKELTGAEAALVVNNNAAAVMLLLTATTQGQEVLISRGELVEIGGSFRVPDVIESVGARLKEVGATNKTHLRDYERAITEETGALLRVHTSNYRVVGFSQVPDDKDLVALAHQHDLPAFNDLGSGLLIDLQPLGLPREPLVSEVVAAGYDVVSFSGDKLLGGPQAGILVGTKQYIDQLKRHPLLRALRVDKMTLAGLEATLQAYLKPEQAMKDIPLLQMLGQSEEKLARKAQMLVDDIRALNKGYQVNIIEGQSQVGGGAFPEARLATHLVEISHPDYSESTLEQKLRQAEFPIIARTSDGKVQFDVRTLLEADSGKICQALVEMI
ncbi:L-seryl-tRNA(Sec) selenium transferase [Dolosigranulum pigrum]|uniref:L-seryl-tRNA(Sec) selenium transferase n=1 Tax=Dolosigranulum pigrum TaxID=29394 RepID=UPI001AD86A7E|nr:L-seryl-tRNA(Sec) selenium transferase [Dolosigranulum pigrum]QTJ43806.1 L-seryl-tRNA(Sec) selenium transferase [Dolosigranulum pigrum]QTJ47230.1 L-seryl-tRNA(Sec) selenium transferase [Dolosigranulum pigrum]QTJ60738.1 L-seryl-tRNA(Sec) selenium transferase [Dolosigranulum pigrum]